MIEPEFESERSVRGRVELLMAWTSIIEMVFEGSSLPIRAKPN
jgi:hypothetical protein